MNVCFAQYLPKCDRIFLLHQGRIAENGTHAQLMDAKSMYHDLYYMYQMKYNETQHNRCMSGKSCSESQDG